MYSRKSAATKEATRFQPRKRLIRSLKNTFELYQDGKIASRSLSENFLFIGSPQSCNCSTWKWRIVASDETLWSNLFRERWGTDCALFYAPADSKSWKDVYVVQDRCDRVGLGLKIIREGGDYYLVHQGEIQRHLGSRTIPMGSICNSLDPESGCAREESRGREEPCLSILDKILFFVGDLEAASQHAKRRRPL